MIETITAALAVGTFWFWSILALASVLIIACTENEHYPTPTIIAILLGVVYWKDIVAAPWQTIAIVVGVFALGGVIWSAFKWFRYVQKVVNRYTEENGKVLTESQMGRLEMEISPYRNKARITGWIAFWPWSLFWTITGDFFNMLYDSMVGVYQSISNRGMKKFTVKPPEETPSVTKNKNLNSLEGFRNR